jgi:hypothetical protein
MIETIRKRLRPHDHPSDRGFLSDYDPSRTDVFDWYDSDPIESESVRTRMTISRLVTRLGSV